MNQMAEKLPDEVRAAIGETEAPREEQLARLSATIAQLRDEAVDARKESGIEHEWTLCEEAYAGIDDLNRHEFKEGVRWNKPATMEGSLTSTQIRDTSHKATAYVKLTARYVDAGHAKVCEIALPADGKAFTLKATPVPELSQALGDKRPAQDIAGQPMPGHDGQPVTVDALAKHVIEQAEEAAEKAATRIHDWLTECKHTAEMRKVVFDGARLGAGVLCGPIPDSKRTVVVRRTAATDPAMPAMTPVAKAAISVEVVDETKPVTRWVDVWNFYPAPGCGEDIHRGSHCFESDSLTQSELAKLVDKPHYLPEQIKKVLAEGPGKIHDNGAPNNERSLRSKKPFTVWHFRGEISRAEFEAANETQASEVDKAIDQVSVVITLINDTAVKAVLSPMDSGRLPYHVFTWRRRAGHWAGVGVAEQVRTPQRVVTGGTRALLNNGGLSSGSQVVMDPNMVEPANGDMKITPDKLWFIKSGLSVEDVNKVFAAFEWPNRTEQLMKIIEYGFKLAEEHSSIPLITQGQSGDTTPDTFGGQQLQDNNANQLLRDVGFGLNDTVTTPLVDQFYEVLLLDPEVPDDEKGDYHVDTSGALAMIEKALQDLFLPQLLTASANPIFELDPAKCMEQVIRSKRMSPADFRLTEQQIEERKKQPPPVAPVVEAAQIRAASAEKIAKSADELAAEKVRVDSDRDRQYNDSLARREESTIQLRLRELEITRDLKMLEYALQQKMSIDDAKVQLADTAMKLRVQKELAGIDGEGPQVATPPDEPPGRAPDGEAYQR